MSILFDLLFFVGYIIYLPYLLFKRKLHGAFVMRLGFLSERFKKILNQKKNIWLHAVSVGEVMSVLGLIGKLKKKFPKHQIVLTTVTITGYALAVSRTQDIDLVLYSPLDFSFVVRKYINLIRPKIYIVAETEIWPNLFLSLKKNSVPIILINGRISDRAFKKYFCFRGLLKNILDCVDIFSMQSQLDCDRIHQMGAPQDKIRLAGNLKFDDLSDPFLAIGSAKVNFRAAEIPWVAGSTHPGEEKIILEVFKSLLSQHESLRLILAPRHTNRVVEIEREVKSFGFKSVRFSELQKNKKSMIDNQTVIVVDTIGHLKFLYQLAKIVFVGKSLTIGGGHNIIEPAFFANPVLVGPLMQNFKDIIDSFLQDRAVIQVQDIKQLEEKMLYLLSNPQEMIALGQRALQMVQKYQGATQKSLEEIRLLLLRSQNN